MTIDADGIWSLEMEEYATDLKNQQTIFLRKQTCSIRGSIGCLTNLPNSAFSYKIAPLVVCGCKDFRKLGTGGMIDAMSSVTLYRGGINA